MKKIRIINTITNEEKISIRFYSENEIKKYWFAICLKEFLESKFENIDEIEFETI